MKKMNFIVFFILLIMLIFATCSCETFWNIIKDVLCNFLGETISSVKIGEDAIMIVTLRDSTSDVIVEPYTKLYGDIMIYISKEKIPGLVNGSYVVYQLE